MKDRIIRIYWHKAMPYDEALKSELTLNQGLYYITRKWGNSSEKSLYIGKASHYNTIRHRLKVHRYKWYGEKLVRVGEIIYPKNVSYDEMNLIIDHAESAIIYEKIHKAMKMFVKNKAKKKSYSYYNLYRIENEGDIFELQPKIRMHEQE